ncbi:hypothetical protein ACFYWY_35710 [Streptomyces sp. NPDC002870]|uniref:hypothetical protein n=1 Tax=Streptomyces sp. NPDC002870 TaxID=3364666 RepID=UPI0036757B10
MLDGLLGLGVRGQVVNVASGVSFAAEEIVTAVDASLGQQAHRVLREVPPESLRIANRRMHFGLGPGYLDRLITRYVPARAGA